MSLLILVVVFFVVTMVMTNLNKKKSGYKKTYKRKTSTLKSIHNQIDQEPKKVERNKPLYAVPSQPQYSPWDTALPENEECIKWTNDFLKSLEWKRFEDVCMEYLRIKNCDANVTCIGADGGIDIRISDSNGKVFTIGQCKAFSKPIGVNLIRELYGVMAAEGAKHGIFLTTSTYHQPALEFAKDKNLILIDGNEFINLINGLKDEDKKRIDKVATAGDYTTPTCVSCNVKMVKRITKTGGNIGREFWGCVNFPKCRNRMHVKKS